MTTAQLQPTASVGAAADLFSIGTTTALSPKDSRPSRPYPRPKPINDGRSKSKPPSHHSSQHRALALVDALVAAVAEARDLTVLQYDTDFELDAEITGQAQEWVVARGTAD